MPDKYKLSRLPRPAVFVHIVKPFLAYGTLYFTFLFTDRMVGWTASDAPLPLFLWFRTSYELGMDWALIALVFTIAVLEYTIHEFGRVIIPYQQFFLGAAYEEHNRHFTTFYRRQRGMLLVACSMLVPRSGGGSQGVASLTVSFTYLIEKYLTPVHEAVRETFLVQEDGRMVVRSSQVLGQARHTDLDEVYAMPPFPEPALTEALGPTAGTVYADEGATLYVHHPLGNGWWFVAEVAPDLAAAKAP